MTIHMQEAEAARDFSKVMDHVRAGDTILIDCDGEATAAIEHASSYQRRRGLPVVKDTLALLAKMEAERGPLIPDEHWETDMRKAREVFNQPIEDRTSWG